MLTTTPFTPTGVYDPRSIRTLCTVFDTAWAAIEHNFGPSSREAARLQLATVVLELAAAGDCDALELKCRAIGAMHRRAA
jgi:hypothetical protein